MCGERTRRHLSQRQPLLDEPGAAPRIQRVDGLDCHLHVEHAVARQVDRSHASGANLPVDLVLGLEARASMKLAVVLSLFESSARA